MGHAEEFSDRLYLAFEEARAEARRRREKFGQADLGRRVAEIMGQDRPILQATVSKWMAKERPSVPDPATIRAIAIALGVSPAWLAWGDLPRKLPDDYFEAQEGTADEVAAAKARILGTIRRSLSSGIAAFPADLATQIGAINDQFLADIARDLAGISSMRQLRDYGTATVRLSQETLPGLIEAAIAASDARRALKADHGSKNTTPAVHEEAGVDVGEKSGERATGRVKAAGGRRRGS